MDITLILNKITSAEFAFGGLYLLTSGNEIPTNLCCEETSIQYQYYASKDEWSINSYFRERDLPKRFIDFVENKREATTVTRTEMENLIEYALQATPYPLYMSVTTINNNGVSRRSLFKISLNEPTTEVENPSSILCPVTFG